MDEDGGGSSEPVLYEVIGRGGVSDHSFGPLVHLGKTLIGPRPASEFQMPGPRDLGGASAAVSRSGLWRLTRIVRGASVVVSGRGAVLGPPPRDNLSRALAGFIWTDVRERITFFTEQGMDPWGPSAKDEVSRFKPHSLEYTSSYPRSRDPKPKKGIRELLRWRDRSSSRRLS